MRQGNPNNKQQQQRMRGRSNNNNGGNVNRKGPNPLSRSYESTGPDVKIRGTALHIAEKYVQLARDAQSSGDRVLAESYLQHAEHYYRIIAAAQAQLQQPITVVRTDIQGDDDDDDDLDTAVDVRATSYAPVDTPQPFIEDAGNEAAGQADRSNGDRSPQDRDRPMTDRPQRDRFGRDRGERSDRGERFVQDRDQADRGGERVDRGLDRDRNADRDRNGDRPIDRSGDRSRLPNGQRGYRDNFRANGGRNGDGRSDTGPNDGNRGQAEGNRFEAPAGEGARADAARLEARVDGRPEYRSDRGERFVNRGDRSDFRGDRAPRERPQYRSERADRPDRADRFEGERREVRIDLPEVVEERPVAEPVMKSELPAFITGIPPRVESKAERPAKIDRTEEVVVKAAPTPEPVSDAGDVVVPVKRPRGRPRKVPIVVAPVTASED
jgi:hypothetical protein